MADYNKDEVDRQEKGWPKSVEIGKERKISVDVDINDDIFLRVAKEAHARDITFNSMVNIIVKNGINHAEHRFEHHDKPQFLTENK